MIPAPAPGWRLQACNFIVFQVAWFAAVLGAAHGQPAAGTLCVAVAIAWHLAVSARPAREAALVLAACGIGLVFESFVVLQGNVRYPSGQPIAQLAPYWMVALWGLLAIGLNVTMRWLHGRLWLAAALGAVAGPAAFAAGVRLGGAQFVHARPALLTLALAWSALMPLLIVLARRLDGVVPQEKKPHA